jgi:UDPglucose 6-dehydrogenase
MSIRMTVIGTGYLGAVHAACMANLGFEVLGVDNDIEKIAVLASGKTPFFEPGLDESLSRALATGRLRFTTSLAEAAEFGDVHFVCVGTPQKDGSYAADLRHVDGVITGLAPMLTRPCLVVGKSTVPVGTARRLAGMLRELSPIGDEVELAWNPEFLREGFAVQDTMSPDRIVLGVETPSAEAVLRDVYASMIEREIPVMVTDYATAELVKVSANAFLATKISFINAMAEVCEATGADVTMLADAIGADARIGRTFLGAGLGFGGGCLPKDIRAFMARAGELGVDQALTFLREVDEINMRRRHRVVELTREVLGGRLLGMSVACLGAAFKPDSDDVRDSPALNVAAALQLQGARVRVADPEATSNAHKLFPTLSYTTSGEEAVAGADAVLLLTEWREYRDLDPVHVGGLVRERKIVDARNALDPAAWRAAGWTYKGVGRP